MAIHTTAVFFSVRGDFLKMIECWLLVIGQR